MGIVDQVAGALGRVAEAVRIGVRTLTPLDTNRIPRDWEHVTKVDPEEEKALPLLYPLYLQHTSAVSVGGSRDVTVENTTETFEALSGVSVPTFHEPSAAEHVTADTYESCSLMAVPEVLNGDAEALVGSLGKGAVHIREELGPALLRERVGWLPARWRRKLAEYLTSWLFAAAVFEAYVIQNPDSAAAREAGVTAEDVLAPEEAAERALAAERHLGSEVIYVEYSGSFGGQEAVETVGAIADTCSWSRVWYGGGLDSRDRVERILEAGADTVIVGNAFHEIAEEERSICSRAVDELGADASRGDVRDWMTDAVDVGSSSATRFLETVPSVSDPEMTATRYLVETVRVRLALEALATDFDDADAPEIRLAIEGRDDLPGVDELAGATSDPIGVARHIALGHLATRTAGTDVAQFSTVRFGGVGAAGGRT